MFITTIYCQILPLPSITVTCIITHYFHISCRIHGCNELIHYHTITTNQTIITTSSLLNYVWMSITPITFTFLPLSTDQRAPLASTAENPRVLIRSTYTSGLSFKSPGICPPCEEHAHSARSMGTRSMAEKDGDC